MFSHFSKKKREPSLRESLLGEPENDKLPKGFFEKVLDCELRLKQKFSMNLLQELISLYTTAIEYFESVDDPRYKQYNQNLNLLFTQPEVIRAMNGKKFRRIEKKAEIMKKLEKSEKSVTNQNVQNIIRSTSQTHISEKINKEVDNQVSNFQKKKEEKKKKYLLSTSDITDAVKTMKNKRVNTNVNTQNKSVDIIQNENDKSGDEIIADTSNILGELNLNNNNMVNETPKKKLNSKIKMNMDVYFNEYFEYFVDKIVPNIVTDYENEYNKKIEKECESGVNYVNQIKEMEFLLTSDADQSYKEQIGKIIFQLQEEEKVENEKIKEEYDFSVKKIDDKYLTKQILESPGINLMQEKFKLDMCNTLSGVLNK